MVTFSVTGPGNDPQASAGAVGDGGSTEQLAHGGGPLVGRAASSLYEHRQRDAPLGLGAVELDGRRRHLGMEDTGQRRRERRLVGVQWRLCSAAAAGRGRSRKMASVTIPSVP